MPSVVHIGTATDNKNLFDLVRGHLVDTATAGGIAPDANNVGDGGITELFFKTTSVPQTFTLTCTAAATNAGTFSVFGSVTGSMGNATVGVDFDHAQIKFNIIDGPIDFAVNDEIIITAVGWIEEELRVVADAGDFTNRRESCLKAPGASNEQSIYINIGTYDNVGDDVHNWKISGAISYNPLNDFDEQPDASTVVYMPLWNFSIEISIF